MNTPPCTSALIYDVEIAKCIPNDAAANLPYLKSGSGALAPAMWQRGQKGAVLDYSLRDVQITKALFDKRDALTDPTDGSTLTCREPGDA